MKFQARKGQLGKLCVPLALEETCAQYYLVIFNYYEIIKYDISSYLEYYLVENEYILH